MFRLRLASASLTESRENDDARVSGSSVEQPCCRCAPAGCCLAFGVLGFGFGLGFGSSVARDVAYSARKPEIRRLKWPGGDGGGGAGCERCPSGELVVPLVAEAEEVEAGSLGLLPVLLVDDNVVGDEDGGGGADDDGEPRKKFIMGGCGE